MIWNSAFGNRGVWDNFIEVQFLTSFTTSGNFRGLSLKIASSENQTGSRFKYHLLTAFAYIKVIRMCDRCLSFEHFASKLVLKKALRIIGRHGKNKHSDPILLFEFFNVLYMALILSSMIRFQRTGITLRTHNVHTYIHTSIHSNIHVLFLFGVLYNK